MVSIFAADDGGYVLELRPAEATGTSPYVKFKTQKELFNFFRQLDLSDAIEQEIEGIVQALQQRTAYHQKMFLPTAVEEAMLEVHGTAKHDVPGLAALVSNSAEPI